MWATMHGEDVTVHCNTFRFGSQQTAWLRATTTCYNGELTGNFGILRQHEFPDKYMSDELARVPEPSIRVLIYENNFYCCCYDQGYLLETPNS